MPNIAISYTAVLRTPGTQSGPGIDWNCTLRMLPAYSTSGSGSRPIPTAKVLLGGVTGTAYSETIDAQGGVSPYTFTVISGTLPTSLSLSSGGLISGTPTVAGTYDFTVQAKDTNGATGTTNFEITITTPSSGATNYGFVA
jgi:large repetitive protein